MGCWFGIIVQGCRVFRVRFGRSVINMFIFMVAMCCIFFGSFIV